MPKKRRTPKQKAASRRNLVKARAARKHSGKIPSNKSKAYVTVYHTTTKNALKSISAKGFRESKRYPKVFGPKGTTLPISGPVWVTTAHPDTPKGNPVNLVSERFGTKATRDRMVTVGMRVPRKATRPDPHARNWKHSRIVPAQALTGVKLYRIK